MLNRPAYNARLAPLSAAAQSLLTATGEPSYDSFLDEPSMVATDDGLPTLVIFANASSNQAQFSTFVPTADEASAPSSARPKALLPQQGRANVIWVDCSASASCVPGFRAWLSDQSIKLVPLKSLVLDRRVVPARIAIHSAVKPALPRSPTCTADVVTLLPRDEAGPRCGLLFRARVASVGVKSDLGPRTLLVARHFVEASDDGSVYFNDEKSVRPPLILTPFSGVASSDESASEHLWAETFVGLMVTLSQSRCHLVVEMVSGEDKQGAARQFALVSPVTAVSATLRAFDLDSLQGELGVETDASCFVEWERDALRGQVLALSGDRVGELRYPALFASLSEPPSSADHPVGDRRQIAQVRQLRSIADAVDLNHDCVSRTTSSFLQERVRAIKASRLPRRPGREEVELQTDLLESLRSRVEEEDRKLLVDAPSPQPTPAVAESPHVRGHSPDAGVEACGGVIVPVAPEPSKKHQTENERARSLDFAGTGAALVASAEGVCTISPSSAGKAICFGTPVQRFEESVNTTPFSEAGVDGEGVGERGGDGRAPRELAVPRGPPLNRPVTVGNTVVAVPDAVRREPDSVADLSGDVDSGSPLELLLEAATMKERAEHLVEVASRTMVKRQNGDEAGYDVTPREDGQLGKKDGANYEKGESSWSVQHVENAISSTKACVAELLQSKRARSAVHDCLDSLARLAVALDGEGRQCSNVRKMVKCHTCEEGLDDSVCNGLQAARTRMRVSSGWMVDNDLSVGQWGAIVEALEVVVWLSAAATFALRKRKSRKRLKRIVTRIQTIISCVQVCGELSGASKETTELYQECLHQLFASILTPFMKGWKDKPADWLLDLEQEHGSRNMLVTPDKRGKRVSLEKQGHGGGDASQGAGATVSFESERSSAGSCKRARHVAPLSPYEGRPRKVSRWDDEEEDSTGMQTRSCPKVRMKRAAEILKGRKEERKVVGRTQFASVENRMNGGNTLNRLAIRPEVAKTKKRNRHQERAERREREDRLEAFLRDFHSQRCEEPSENEEEVERPARREPDCQTRSEYYLPDAGHTSRFALDESVQNPADCEDEDADDLFKDLPPETPESEGHYELASSI